MYYPLCRLKFIKHFFSYLHGNGGAGKMYEGVRGFVRGIMRMCHRKLASSRPYKDILPLPFPRHTITQLSCFYKSLHAV